MKPKRVIFLMSDTGGGHRSAAEAIRVAMQRTCPGAYTFELVDVYRRYTPFPFRYMPEMYPRWVNGAGSSWAATYRFANAPGRADLSMALIKRLWGRGMRLMAKRHTGDVIVCVHALFSRPALRAYRQISRLRPPFVTVVTDLVSTHAFWYEPGVDRCLVPTQAAFDRGV
jgi:1,2-diacylglycerol 3-beta-galactosyltransferase